MRVTASPVTTTLNLGPLATLAPTPTSAPIVAKPASSVTGTAGRLAELVALVVGAAVLLGLGGAVGLYLTRRRHE